MQKDKEPNQDSLVTSRYWLVSKSGFTIIEILMSIALVTVIAGIGVPLYQSLQVKNDFDLAVRHYVESLRRSQILAQGTHSDARWGVKINADSLVLFKGASYAMRDLDFDEVYAISGNIVSSGMNEIVFEKFTGYPLIIGITTFTSANNDSRTITINSKGIINY